MNAVMDVFLLILFFYRRCSIKKVFLKFSKIHRKIPVPESLFIKKETSLFIKKEAVAQVFSCEF